MTTNPLTTLSRLTFEAPDDAALEAGVRAVAAPGFTFRQDGRRTDTEGFLTHLRELRSAASIGEVTIFDALLDRSTAPARAAARVSARMTMTDGSITQGESLMVAVLDGNRIVTLHEIGRYLAAGDDPPEPTV